MNLILVSKLDWLHHDVDTVTPHVDRTCVMAGLHSSGMSCPAHNMAEKLQLSRRGKAAHIRSRSNRNRHNTWGNVHLVFLGVQSVVQRFAHQKEPECVGVGWRVDQFIDVWRFTTATSAQLLPHDWLEGVRPARLQRHREALRLLQPQGTTTQWSGFESLQLASARTALTAVCVCVWTGSRWRHTVHVLIPMSLIPNDQWSIDIIVWILLQMSVPVSRF